MNKTRLIAWIFLSFIAAPFAGVTAAICWLQDKVAGKKHDLQYINHAHNENKEKNTNADTTNPK